ncbi:MAG TPA: rhodanese-like domain-containing protein [Thermoanaerobaculia bacterium]|nr:rhodanese-like domain-containing protein [Thermoanaerobaculia bacterium]
MPDRRFFAEIAALIIAATLCAAVANAVSSRERNLAWAGEYPNARVIPQGAPAAILLPTAPESEPAPSPAPDAGPESGTAAGAQPEPAATPAATAAAKQPAAPPPAAKAPRFTLADFPTTPSHPAVEITSEQARALYQLRAPFIDARRTQVYEQGHIAGALSMPVWESDVDERVVGFYEEGHPGEAPIVVYCSGGACEDSHMLAQKLWGLGYNNVLVYKDGWPDWQAHGMPVERGPAR